MGSDQEEYDPCKAATEKGGIMPTLNRKIATAQKTMLNSCHITKLLDWSGRSTTLYMRAALAFAAPIMERLVFARTISSMIFSLPPTISLEVNA